MDVIKMAKIIDFPAVPSHIRCKSELANYLRKMADYIDDDSIESGPVAIMMVLTSERQHEVLNVGYQTKADFQEAALSAYKYSTAPYQRRGGNKYPKK